MNVKFYGHNCFLLTGSESCVLTDPWLSRNGAFFGSWFQWPVNHDLLAPLIDDLKTRGSVTLYISHEHQDHFDVATLKEIRPHITKCVIPDYHDKFLKNELVSIGYEVTELADLERHDLGSGDYMELMLVDTGVNHDSVAIVSINDEIFVNQNDCKIFDRLNYLEGKGVNYYSVQFSGATWHPVCYEISEDEKRKISKKKVQSKLIAVKKAIAQIKPEFYLPSAGPAIFPFLPYDLSSGDGNIFVHQPRLDEILTRTESRIAFLQPGDVLEKTRSYSPIPAPLPEEISSIKASLYCQYNDLSEESLNIEGLKEQIDLRLGEISDLVFEKCPKLIFNWGDGGFVIDINAGSIDEVALASYQYPDSYLQVSASPKYFNLMANPRYRWQDIYLSLRASVKRQPDVFNTFINIFLFSDVSNIRAGFETTLNINDERIVIVNPNDGKNYEVNRYCPHNGSDLKDAKIDANGNLICPRHSWLFNLENGGKCNTADASINALEIENTISICETVSTRLVKYDQH